MHDSAMDNCSNFIKKYVTKIRKPKITVVDVGSMDFNGTLRSLFSNHVFKYIGLDIEKGRNVDVVLRDPYKLPFKSRSVDVVVSTSCFEHNEMFWLTFKEMVRIVRPGGYIYLNAPYKDGIHEAPVDCWRFLPDGMKALAKWCPGTICVETYIDERPHKDCVGIFKIK